MAGLIPIGSIPAAGDVTTGAVIRQPGSWAQRAVDERVRPAAEAAAIDVLANDPGVAAAASAAVDAKVAGLDLVKGDDERLPKTGEPDSFRVMDEGGSVALEVAADGSTRVFGPLRQGAATTIPGSSPVHRVMDRNGAVAMQVDGQGRTFIYDLQGGGGGGGTPVSTRRVVFLIMLGQSNGEGRGTPYGPRLDPPHSRVQMAVWDAGVVTEIAEATVPLSSQYSQVGLSFASVIGKQMAVEGDERTEVVILNAAVGGSGLVSTPPSGTWAVDYAGSNPRLYPIALGAITATLDLITARYPGATVEPWIFWHQGEADGSTGQAAYEAALDALIDGVRTHLGDGTVPFTAGGLVPEMIAKTPALAPIRRALFGVQSRKEYAAYTDGVVNGGGAFNTADTVHYARAGVEKLGAKMLRAGMRAAASTTTSVPHKPLTVTATRSGTTVSVTWDEPDSRYTGFLVEYDVDGAGWVTAPRDIAEECAQQITGITGNTVQVRVSTINAALTTEPTTPVTAIGA